jgi:hypothetical protein
LVAEDDPDEVGWARVDEEPEELPPPVPPQASLDEYRPLAGRASLARAALVLITLVSVVAVVFDVAERSLLARVGSGEPVTADELAASDDRQLAIALTQAGLGILAAIFFIAWLSRAYKNLPALGVQLLRYGPGWAIGAWFVPILNLFRPKQIVNDVWRGSDPKLADRVGWIDGPVPFLFAVWWAAWLVFGFVGTVADRILLGAETIDDYELSSAVYIATDSLIVLAGILAVLVVDMTTARQAARVAAVGGGDHPGARAPRWLRGGRHAAAAASLCALAVGAGLLTIAVQPEGSDAAPASELGDTVVEPALAAPAGFSLTDDFSDPGSGWSELEDPGGSFAYSEDEWVMTVNRPQESWFSFLDLGVSVAHVAVEADARLRAPATDDDAVGIGCFASDLAGYLVSIWPDGYYAIGIDPVDSEQVALLADGSTPEAAAVPVRWSRIGIECESGPPAILTLTVDGRRIATTRHAEGLGAFELAALIASSGPDSVTVRFDNLEVRRLGD